MTHLTGLKRYVQKKLVRVKSVLQGVREINKFFACIGSERPQLMAAWKVKMAVQKREIDSAKR